MLALLCSVCLLQAKPTSITFRFRDYTPPAINLAPYSASTQGIFKTTITRAADGAYHFSADLPKPAMYSINTPGNDAGFEFYIEPGDSLNVTLRQRQFGVSVLNYTGNNAGKLVYEYFERRHFDMATTAIQNQDAMQSRKGPDYAHFADSVCNMRLNMLVAFDQFTRFWSLSRFYLTPEYITDKAASYIYTTADDKLGYTAFRASQEKMMMGGSQDSLELKYQQPENYYTFTHHLSFANDALVHNQWYLRYVKSLMHYRYQLAQEQFKKQSGKEYVAGYFTYTSQTLNGKTKEAVLGTLITEAYRFGNQSSIETLAQKFIPTVQDTQIKSGLVAILDYYRPLSKNEKAPDFVLKDLNGNEVALSDYKDKTVLLNFTSLGCMGCRLQGPYERRLQKEFENDSFVLIKVYLDEDPKYMADEKKNNADETVLAIALQGYQSEVAQTYKVSAVPQYFLIKPGGRFALSGQSFPNDPETESQIRETFKPQAMLSAKESAMIPKNARHLP